MHGGVQRVRRERLDDRVQQTRRVLEEMANLVFELRLGLIGENPPDLCLLVFSHGAFRADSTLAPRRMPTLRAGHSATRSQAGHREAQTDLKPSESRGGRR